MSSLKMSTLKSIRFAKILIITTLINFCLTLQITKAQTSSYANHFVSSCMSKMKEFRVKSVSLSHIYRCFVYFDPNNSDFISKNDFDELELIDLDYLSFRRIIKFISKVEYVERGLKKGEFTLKFTFRKDLSSFSVEFPGSNYCSSDVSKKLCVWDGSDRIFIIENKDKILAYDYTVYRILSDLRGEFQNQSIVDNIFYF